MTSQHKHEPEETKTPLKDPSQTQENTEFANDDAEKDQIQSLILALEAEKADLKDKVLRTLAEMENLRRRTEREVAEARIYATTNFARDMLSVIDNLSRALDAFPTDEREKASAGLQSLIEGIELTRRDLLATLNRNSVKQIEPKGQKFDPNLHQAMFEVPNNELANGTVIEVIQSGFVIGDRVLRPALVGVSKAASQAKTES